MTLDQVRHFALSLPEVIEAPHFDRTSFRIRGRMIATAAPGSEYLHIFVTATDRETALEAAPDFLEELRWGKRVVGLRVLLVSARPSAVHKLLTHAWSSKAPKKLLASFSTTLVDGNC